MPLFSELCDLTANTRQLRTRMALAFACLRIRIPTSCQTLTASYRRRPGVCRYSPASRRSNRDACWRLGSGPFQDGPIAEKLELELDSEKHGMVGPVEAMSVTEYRSAIEATREAWSIVGEGDVQ